jgi:hypothetical protein
MSVPTPGYSRAELLDAYNAFTARLDAAVSRDTERAEAMTRLRRVCSGGPPDPPQYLPEVDPFRRNPIGSPNCDHVMPRPWRRAEILALVIPLGLLVLSLVLAVSGALSFGPN